MLHKTGKRMDACIQIHLPVVRTWSTKCGMSVCRIEKESSCAIAEDRISNNYEEEK